MEREKILFWTYFILPIGAGRLCLNWLKSTLHEKGMLSGIVGIYNFEWLEYDYENYFLHFFQAFVIFLLEVCLGVIVLFYAITSFLNGLFNAIWGSSFPSFFSIGLISIAIIFFPLILLANFFVAKKASKDEVFKLPLLWKLAEKCNETKSSRIVTIYSISTIVLLAAFIVSFGVVFQFFGPITGTMIGTLGEFFSIALSDGSILPINPMIKIADLGECKAGDIINSSALVEGKERQIKLVIITREKNLCRVRIEMEDMVKQIAVEQGEIDETNALTSHNILDLMNLSLKYGKYSGEHIIVYNLDNGKVCRYSFDNFGGSKGTWNFNC